MNVLVKHAQKREKENFELLAILHGAKPKKKPSTASSQFDYDGDPESYKDMTQEEKENLTQKMMAEHKKMFEKSGLYRGDDG